MTSLRAFATWAGFPDLFKDYNAPDAGDPQPHPIPEGMAGVRRMLAATENESQQALIALQGMCGLRVAEALAVRASDFTFQGLDGKSMLKVMGKGSVVRHVPVSDEAFNYLVRRYMRTVGTDQTLVGLKDRYARRIITELGARVGLMRTISSHDLRATFATALYNKTKSQRLVQVILGHANGKTTELYIGVEVADMQRGVEGL